jgi:hypothetical protein
MRLKSEIKVENTGGKSEESDNKSVKRKSPKSGQETPSKKKK